MITVFNPLSMKFIASFSVSAKIKLQNNISPEDGFFYIQEVAFNDSISLLSNFVDETSGTTSFWEEFVETSWDEEGEGIYSLSVTGENIGLDISDDHKNLEELAGLLESGDFEASMGFCFKRDGDEGGNLIEGYTTFPVDYFEGKKASDDEFQEFGYD